MGSVIHWEKTFDNFLFGPIKDLYTQYFDMNICG